MLSLECKVCGLLWLQKLKEINFVWDNKCEGTFMELKWRLTTTLVLTIPNSEEPYMVYTDAFGMGWGCVLMQQGKAITYASR